MLTFACERCGAPLPLPKDGNIVRCDSCNSVQSIPSQEEERIKNLFVRANELRRKSEFDKAAGVYSAILNEMPASAAAYWGALLCEFGIEYVEDERTQKRIPTCHRSSTASLLENTNYTLALQYADDASRAVYEQEAEVLERLRVSIAKKAHNTTPVDIFICYKETGADGARTQDSVLAQKLYLRLSQKEGYRCFFAKETLKQYPGEEYEPYIFSALHSAKVMLVVCTCREYLDAPWVKNEWGRYLALMQKDSRVKRRIIPCIKGMSADDLPEAFVAFEAIDLANIGAEEDLVLGVHKVLKASTGTQANNSHGHSSAASTRIQRAFMECSFGNWEKALAICDEALNLEPSNAEAYLAFLMAKEHCFDKSSFRQKCIDSPKLTKEKYFTQGLVRFAEGELEAWINECLQARQEKEKKEAEERRIRAEKEAEERRIRAEKEAEERRIRAVRYIRKHQLTEQIKSSLEQWAEAHQVAVMAQRFLHVSAGGFSAIFCDSTSKRRMAFFDCSSQQMSVSEADRLLQTRVWGKGLISLFLDGTLSNTPDEAGVWTAIESTGTTLYALRDNGGVRMWSRRKDNGTPVFPANVQAQRIYASPYGVVAIGSEEAHIRLNTGDYKIWDTPIGMAAGGKTFLVGLRPFGSFVTLGEEIVPPSWEEQGVVAIAAGDNHLLALTQDGHVLATGDNGTKQCDVEKWEKCVAIAAGADYSVGITSNGTLLSTRSALQKAFTEHKIRLGDWEHLLSKQRQAANAARLRINTSIDDLGRKQLRLISKCKLKEHQVKRLREEVRAKA